VFRRAVLHPGRTAVPPALGQGCDVYSRPMGRSPRTRVSRALAVACAAAALAACRGGGTDRLVLGSVRLPAVALVFIAEESGCFADEGLAVEIREFQTGRDALKAMRGGEVDVATAFQTPVVLQAFEDDSLRVVTMLHTASQNTHMAARADRGIREVGDLRGKRIGVPRRTNAEFFVRTLLAFEGVDPAEVTLVDLLPERSAAALASGEVDAVAVWSPHVEDAAAALPAGEAVEFYSDAYMELSVLATREEVRTSRRRALTKLVRCLRRAEVAVESAPDRGLALARRIFPREDADKLARQWTNVTPQLGLQNVLVSILTQEAEWLRAANGIDRAVPRFSSLLAPEFLEAVHPDSLTYVKGR
jgi:ABC-type nitrate/sulfonate/bicarbonate transport system substrate-binding protein